MIKFLTNQLSVLQSQNGELIRQNGEVTRLIIMSAQPQPSTLVQPQPSTSVQPQPPPLEGLEIILADNDISMLVCFFL